MPPQSNLGPSVKHDTRADSTAATPGAILRASVLASLILPMHKELKEAHYRIVAESREARERAGREFRMSQPGICEEYLPYGPATPRLRAYENALLCSFARHLCTAQQTRFGQVPTLQAADLQATEPRAKRFLANRRRLRRLERLGAVQFALRGILGGHDFDGIKVIPERKRVLLKVLTLLICTSDAIKDRQQQPATDEPAALTSH